MPSWRRLKGDRGKETFPNKAQSRPNLHATDLAWLSFCKTLAISCVSCGQPSVSINLHPWLENPVPFCKSLLRFVLLPPVKNQSPSFTDHQLLTFVTFVNSCKNQRLQATQKK